MLIAESLTIERETPRREAVASLATKSEHQVGSSQHDAPQDKPVVSEEFSHGLGSDRIPTLNFSRMKKTDSQI